MIISIEERRNKYAELKAYLISQYAEIYYSAMEKIALQSFRPELEDYHLTGEEKQVLSLINNKVPEGIR